MLSLLHTADENSVYKKFGGISSSAKEYVRNNSSYLRNAGIILSHTYIYEEVLFHRYDFAQAYTDMCVVHLPAYQQHVMIVFFEIWLETKQKFNFSNSIKKKYAKNLLILDIFQYCLSCFTV
jgi:hypothetical protein